MGCAESFLNEARETRVHERECVRAKRVAIRGVRPMKGCRRSGLTMRGVSGSFRVICDGRVTRCGGNRGRAVWLGLRAGRLSWLRKEERRRASRRLVESEPAEDARHLVDRLVPRRRARPRERSRVLAQVEALSPTGKRARLATAARRSRTQVLELVLDRRRLGQRRVARWSLCRRRRR